MFLNNGIMKNLHILRKEVDEIDDQILVLLSRRFEITNRIGKIKAENHLPAYDENREKQIVRRLKKKSNELSLNLELTRSIFKSILSETVSNHNNLLNPD